MTACSEFKTSLSAYLINRLWAHAWPVCILLIPHPHKVCFKQLTTANRPKGTKPTKWTKEIILAEANKYATTRAWRASNEYSYQAARHSGILKEARAHMAPSRRPSKILYWDSEIMDRHIEYFNAAASSEIKNQIFTEHLYFPLRHMIEAVYEKYQFRGLSRDHGLRIDLILDHMRVSALAKFDPRRGSSYSFSTSCIKRKVRQQLTRAEAILSEAVSLNTEVNEQGGELIDIALDFAVSPELERASRWGGRDYVRGLIRFLRANRWDFGPEQAIYDTVLEIMEGSGFDPMLGNGEPVRRDRQIRDSISAHLRAKFGLSRHYKLTSVFARISGLKARFDAEYFDTYERC